MHLRGFRRMQALAEGNSSLANRAAAEAKEARAKACRRAEEAEAQVVQRKKARRFSEKVRQMVSSSSYCSRTVSPRIPEQSNFLDRASKGLGMR